MEPITMAIGSAMFSWWGKRSGWAKLFIIISAVVSLLFSTVVPVLSYSISKRNRRIREQVRVMKTQEAKLSILRLELKKQEEENKLILIRKDDKNAKKKLKEGEKKIEAYNKDLKKIKKDRELKIGKVKDMSVDDQIKRSKKLLQEWL